jgi:outer membrane protein assembly factor BamD (BamD/ComL family)
VLTDLNEFAVRAYYAYRRKSAVARLRLEYMLKTFNREPHGVFATPAMKERLKL